MNEQKVKVKSPSAPDGGLVDAWQLGIDEIIERPTEVTLSDETVLRIRTTVVSATRVINQWDAEGNPFYIVNLTTSLEFVSISPGLKRPAIILLPKPQLATLDMKGKAN